MLKESGLPKIRFHDLRHTAASLMLNNGIPMLIVSRRLGHAKPSITLDVYGHLIPSKQEEAASLMDDLMTPIAVDSDTIFAPELHQERRLDFPIVDYKFSVFVSILYIGAYFVYLVANVGEDFSLIVT